MLKHPVHIQAYFLREDLAAIFARMMSLPGRYTEMHVVEVKVEFALSAEHHVALVTGVLLSDPPHVPVGASAPPESSLALGRDLPFQWLLWVLLPAALLPCPSSFL